MGSLSNSQHFNSLASNYSRLRSIGDYDDQLIDILVGLGNLYGRSILDCGCGPGVMLAKLIENYNITGCGLDSSLKMVQIARNTLPYQVGVVLGSAETLPFLEASFERVTISWVIHLLNRLKTFSETARVLVPSGKLLIVTADPQGMENLWLQSFFPSYARHGQKRFPSKNTLISELREVGFDEIMCFPYVQKHIYSKTTVLEKLHQQAFSILTLLDREEYNHGLLKAEMTLPDPVVYTVPLLLISGLKKT